MAKFGKRPIHAEQFKKTSYRQPFMGSFVVEFDEVADRHYVETDRGEVTITDGDWILRDANDRVEACRLVAIEDGHES